MKELVERFKERLDTALERIRNGLVDKEVNNIFYLILYELPYIFSDGKIVGGFFKTSSKQPEGELIDQPLNTLHLTERVIEKDHFDEILSTFKVNGTLLIDLPPNSYSNLPIRCGEIDIQDYLGISNEEKNQNIFQDIIYLFINEVYNQTELCVIFNHTEPLDASSLKGMWDQFQNRFVYQLSQDGAFLEDRVKACLPRPCCVKKNKAPLEQTLSPVSSDNYLYTREYLEDTIDNINQEIEAWLDKKEKANKNSSMRSIFLRTARPDVNYFVPLLTRRMRTAILEKIQTDKKLFEYATTWLFKDFKEYNRLIKRPTITSRPGSHVEQEMWCNYLDDPERLEYFLRDFDSERVDAKALHEALRDIKNQLLEFLTPESKSDCGGLEGRNFVLKYNQNKWEDCLKLLFVINSFAETTPLVGGIAYTTGKRGTPYYSIGWKKGERGPHPFLKRLPEGSAEKELRYPSFMENFFDLGVMEADKFHISINIPVVCNGITFGVFAIYPGVEEHVFLERKSDYLLELTKLVEKHRPDLLRSFFLDICANVTRILSGIERKESAESTEPKQSTTYDLKELINKAQDLIRMAHEVPRTYIIYLGESNREEKIASCLRELPVVLEGLARKLTEVTKREDTRFQFFEERLSVVPELKENTLSCDNYANYKLLNVEGWWFIILQFNTKPAKKFSQRELNNNSYLCQAIETGLAGFKKKYETVQHSTKAAMTAIMSRNLSHNIGSHVLSYWKNRLQDESNTDAGTYTSMQAVVKSSKELLEYLQLRMDFIAEISTSVPCSEISLDFVNDIVNPMIRPNEEKYPEGRLKSISPLLEYLAHSEGINLHGRISLSVDPRLGGNARVSIPNGLIGIHAIYSLFENFIRNGAKHYAAKDDPLLYPYDILDLPKLNQRLAGFSKQAEWLLKAGIRPTDDVDEMVSKLNGLIGTGKLILRSHEFEKIIRTLPKEAREQIEKFDYLTDAEKASVNHLALEKAFPGVISDVHFGISIDKFDKSNDYFQVTMWDLRKNSCNGAIVKILRKFLPGQEEAAFTKGGRLATEGWGIKEMIICSNFLRKKTPDELFENISRSESRDISREVPLIEVVCEGCSSIEEKPCPGEVGCYRGGIKGGRLGIRFYLRAAKDLGIGCGCHKGKNEIFAIEAHVPQEDREIPYRMLTVTSDEFNNYRYNTKAPCRIVPCKDHRELNDVTYLELYESFIKDELWRRNGWPPKLRRCGGAVQGFPKIEPYTADVSVDRRNEISFFYHFPTDEMFTDKAPNEIEDMVQEFMFLQPCSAGYSSWAKIINLPNKPPLRKHFYLELIESALTKIIVIDERISEWANGDYWIGRNRESQTSIRVILKKMNIWVAKLDLEEITPDRLQHSLEEAKRETFYTFDQKPDSVDSGSHFFVIHQGILDKLRKVKKDSDISFMTDINCTWKIVESGRGVPEKMERYNNVRFFEVSILQKLLENFDKHGLVQSLFATRLPPRESR